MQNRVSQMVKTHKCRGVVSLKIEDAKATQADDEDVSLDKNDLQKTYMK